MSTSTTPPLPVAEGTMDRGDPWKDDGNIVLAAEGKYFRVHRSVLSAHSEVFKDMFDCAHQNEAEREFIEHCPVIHLHDAAKDVQIILQAMYDRSYPVPYYEQMHISVVSAFLRLGEKYAIPAFVKEAKAKLRCIYQPSSVEEIGSVPPRLLQALNENDGHKLPLSALYPAMTGGDPHNFEVMNLLQEIDLNASLLITMYQCIVTCPLKTVVDGYQYNDTSYSLSLANLRSFVMMKDVLERYRFRLAKSLLVPSTCSRSNCANMIQAIWADGFSVLPPFDVWKPGWERLFCESCRSSLKAKQSAEVRLAWSQIPSAFGFRSWEELRKSGGNPSLTRHAY